MLFRSAGLIEVDMDRTGAITDVVTERGGTMRDETERGPWKVFVGREPGLDSVRVRGRVWEAPASLLAADTGGRDSVAEVVRVTEGVWMPAVCGRRSGRGTAAREGVVVCACELVTDCGALLESREPEETIELAEALDWVRLRVGRPVSMDVTLSVSIVLRRVREELAEVAEVERVSVLDPDRGAGE